MSEYRTNQPPSGEPRVTKARLSPRDWFSAIITHSLKELLEKKHLYQGVTLSLEDVEDALDKSIVQEATNYYWQPLSPGESLPISLGPRIILRAPDVKLFCEKCDRVEAFNSVKTVPLVHSIQDNLPGVEVFALSYLCQACKSIPEIFLVRREGLKLTLCGRAPIEHVEVPSFIPRSVRSYYKGGILAFQSGQALAANFMLRTLIEQWTRQATKGDNLTRADDITRLLDAYMDSLPKDFKDRFPSMRDLYGDLSSDIHAATGSPELFVRAQEEIVQHFDARRLYRIT